MYLDRWVLKAVKLRLIKSTEKSPIKLPSCFSFKISSFRRFSMAVVRCYPGAATTLEITSSM